MYGHVCTHVGGGAALRERSGLCERVPAWAVEEDGGELAEVARRPEKRARISEEIAVRWTFELVAEVVIASQHTWRPLQVAARAPNSCETATRRRSPTAATRRC